MPTGQLTNFLQAWVGHDYTARLQGVRGDLSRADRTQLFASLVENLSDGIIILTFDGTALFAMSRQPGQYHYRSDQLLKRSRYGGDRARARWRD